MTLDELQQQRRSRWHADGNAVRTFEAAHDFVEQAGFCLMYPEPRQALAPTFIGAWLGTDEQLPRARAAFANPEAAEAEAMKLRLVRERVAYEWPLSESVLLVSLGIFPFFYALAADREGKQQPAWAPGQKLSKLARDTWTEIVRARQPLSEERLREQVGKGASAAALNRALHELWQRLRIMRVDRSERGDVWDTISRVSPNVIKEAEQLSAASALTALVSKYLDAVIAATQEEVETFFSPITTRSKVRDAVNALQAQREISTTQVETRAMLQITPERVPVEVRARMARDPRQQPIRARRISRPKP